MPTLSPHLVTLQAALYWVPLGHLAQNLLAVAVQEFRLDSFLAHLETLWLNLLCSACIVCTLPLSYCTSPVPMPCPSILYFWWPVAPRPLFHHHQKFKVEVAKWLLCLLIGCDQHQQWAARTEDMESEHWCCNRGKEWGAARLPWVHAGNRGQRTSPSDSLWVMLGHNGLAVS